MANRREFIKITGNEEDQHNNGRFCPRGTGTIDPSSTGPEIVLPSVIKRLQKRRVQAGC